MEKMRYFIDKKNVLFLFDSLLELASKSHYNLLNYRIDFHINYEDDKKFKIRLWLI